MSANEPAVLPAAEYEALTDSVAARRPPPVAPARGKVDRAYYWMSIPVLLIFGFFITLPALIGAFFSFTNFAGYGDWEFVGLNNYLNIFQDPTVLQPYLFTFFLAVVCTITVTIVGMAVALGLNAKI
jgi:raffinose/stachyose/melibiose transport system permease protein